VKFAAELSVWHGQDVQTLRSQWAVPELHVLAETGSTNDDARALAESGCPSGSIVIAQRQTAGRGRRGRQWFGTAGQSLHFSIVVRAPAGGFRCLSAAPVRVGLLVLRALAECTGLEPRLKWPNDLLLNGQKTGGILCESVLGGQPFLVVGIGINVGQSRPDFPDEL
jgi:BirA family transcriptional regulator, biotin operon repressor / biotin---[acetyl-CoA-carboxylase] ligase